MESSSEYTVVCEGASQAKIINEIELMKLMDYEYLAKITDKIQAKSITVKTEHLKGSKLADIYTSMEVSDIIKYFIQILLGVGYLHKNNIVHGNLNMDNIYVSEDKKIKITGYAFPNQARKPKDKYYTPRDDVFRIGKILYSLVTLKEYTEEVKKESIDWQSFEAKNKGESKGISKSEVEDLLEKLIIRKDTPSIKEILRINYLQYMAQEMKLLKDIFDLLGEDLEYAGDGKADIEKIKKFLTNPKDEKGENKVHVDEKLFFEELDNDKGEWAYDSLKKGTKTKMFEYYPPHGWCAIGLNVKDKIQEGYLKNEKNPELEWPIAYHGLRPGFIPFAQKIKGILEEGLKQGPNQDKTNDIDLQHPGEKVGKGIFHFYNLNHLIYNQNVGPEKITEEDYFLFAFMCRVNPDGIKQPISNPSQWLLEGNTGNNNGETIPFRLLFKRANIFKLGKDPEDEKENKEH